MNRILQIILVIFVSIQYGYSQVGNNMCEGALPFCTGTSYSFPAGVNAGTGQTGPYYSCLSTRPNPAWYYMKIAIPGMIQITMHSEPAHDIDFCLWGPFDNQNACGQLTSAKVVDCSYSTAATEVVDIANAIAGKYYILIITNYSNQPCNIIFSQTGGQGTTDCTILPPAAGNDGPLCVGETLHLGAANMNNAVYHWIGPDGWSSFLQNPIRTNVTLAMAGAYQLFVTVNGVPSVDTNTTNVAIFNKPTATLSGGGAICQGDSTQLTVTCQNHPPWNVTVTANGQNPVSIPISISPHSFWVHPIVNTTYIITNVANEICNGIASGTAVVSVNPKPLANFTFENNCSGSATLFSDASSILGGYVSAWHWEFGAFGDTSNIQNPTFTYANGGTYSVLLRVTSNNGCKGQVVKPVHINPTPGANAGIDKSIPYGTNTTLLGSGSGGSGSYSYHWEPASLLLDANVANPITVNLSTTTDFTLTIIDLENACQQTDIITVTIIGGPIGVQLSADPMSICHGSTTTINSQTGGGGGTYSYSWQSIPPGFNSTLEDITVSPDVTTTYVLEATDGFNTVTKNITITVYPDPVVTAGSPQTIPNGTYTLLSGSASSTPPYSYSWSPANLVISPLQGTTATALLTATTNFTLFATDGNGCSSSNDILVTVAGGPLMVSPQAANSPICLGESTVLHPMSEGGSGDYTYTWSVGGSTISTSTDPIVKPSATTTYHLVIWDGYTESQGNVTVIVNPLPVVNLIPPGAHIFNTDTILACVFDTLTLNAVNPNATYLWSNGATASEIISATTGMAFDMLSYSVEVSNTLTGCSNTGQLTIMFTFGECSYGIPEGTDAASVMVFPNPNHGVFYCRVNVEEKDLEMEILNLQGATIKRDHFEVAPGVTKTFSIDLSDQVSGVYFLKLSNTNFLRVLRIVRL